MGEVKGFKLVLEDKEARFPVTLYRSSRSGLHVCLVDVPGPVANIFTTFCTETHDSRGIPHSLEHLVFVGAKDFPFRGTLDTLAQFTYSSGTNAWTGQDHTTYTVSAGNMEGLHVLFPLFLDHLFFPLLQDEHFLTEVHAVNGENQDVGVVWCEMQSHEHSLSTLAYLGIASLMYPGTNGFNVETGGRLKDLMRADMNMQSIREYHAKYYRPDNAIVLACASQVNPEQLLGSLVEIDTRLGALVKSLPPFERPFQKPLDPLVAKDVEYDFPCETDSYGRVDIGFRIGLIKDNRDLFTSLAVLTDYLSDGIGSPLHQGLVDLPEPYCRSVDFTADLFSEIGFSIRMNGVPVDRLSQCRNRAMQIMSDLYQKGTIDSERMQSILENSILEEDAELEKSPAETIQDNVALALLYFDVAKDLPDILWGESKRFRMLLKERVSDSKYWLDLLKKYFLDNPHVLLVSRPSVSLHKKLAEDEEKFLAERAEKVDLKELEAALAHATEVANQECPEAVLAELRAKVSGPPDLKKMHHLDTWRIGAAPFEEHRPDWLAAHLHPLEDFPFGLFQADNYEKTLFAEVEVAVNLDGIPKQQVRYLELLLELFFQLPLIGFASHVEVEQAMRKDVLEESASLGLVGAGHFEPGSWPNMLSFCCTCKAEKYAAAVTWLRRSLFESYVTTERVVVAVNALISRLDQNRMSPGKVEQDAVRNLLFKKSSSICGISMAAQEKLLAKWKNKPEAAVVQLNVLLEFVRQRACYSPVVHVCSDLRRIPELHKPWKSWPFSKSMPAHNPEFTTKWSDLLKQSALRKRKLKVLPMVTDGANVTMVWKGPTYADKDDIPLLTCLTEIVAAMEGVAWKAIRGAGLAYGLDMRCSAEHGLVNVDITESASGSDLIEAIQVMLELLEKRFPEILTDSSLEAAKCVTIGRVLSQLETDKSVANSRFYSCFRGYTTSFVLERLLKATKSDILTVWKKYVKKRVKKCLMVVTIDENEAKEFKEDADF